MGRIKGGEVIRGVVERGRHTQGKGLKETYEKLPEQTTNPLRHAGKTNGHSNRELEGNQEVLGTFTMENAIQVGRDSGRKKKCGGGGGCGGVGWMGLGERQRQVVKKKKRRSADTDQNEKEKRERKA